MKTSGHDYRLGRFDTRSRLCSVPVTQPSAGFLPEAGGGGTKFPNAGWGVRPYAVIGRGHFQDRARQLTSQAIGRAISAPWEPRSPALLVALEL